MPAVRAPSGRRGAVRGRSSRAAGPLVALALLSAAPARAQMQEYPVPAGGRPHDVAPALDGGVWYTAQRSGELGWLDPATGATVLVPLGAGSAPHGVIVGPDGAAWITDGGLNAIVRFEPATRRITEFPVPWRNANLNTAVFDPDGVLWFTGQAGMYGRLDPREGVVRACPGARPQAYAVYVDEADRVWVSEWSQNALLRFDPASETFESFPHPGADVRQILGRPGEVWGAMSGQDKLVVVRP